jgi:hypothetical protein
MITKGKGTIGFLFSDTMVNCAAARELAAFIFGVVSANCQNWKNTEIIRAGAKPFAPGHGDVI